MLSTNLDHVTSTEDYNALIKSKSKVAICCGRMGPMCIPVYGAFDALKSKYPEVGFYDMEFDSRTAAETILRLPQVKGFNGLPFTIYYRDGEVVAATSSIQTKAQIKEILDSKLS
ncbi:MAG: thioredoxin family protein [Myxococcota bacterium]|jgi:thioredoxin 1|nr:thioredoxin family protein [Myxococcota bacterium]